MCFSSSGCNQIPLIRRATHGAATLPPETLRGAGCSVLSSERATKQPNDDCRPRTGPPQRMHPQLEPAKACDFFYQDINKEGNSLHSTCGNARGKGIAFECGGFWKHTSESLRENPEPISASKGIEMGRKWPRIEMT